MDPVRLLIVDDEPPLLDLLRRYLERLGYHVEACGNAEDALAKFRAAPEGYRLVITDLTLDGMSGEDMLERMRALTANQRGLICSGYPYEPRLKNVGFLQKPFLPKMLEQAVAQALK